MKSSTSPSVKIGSRAAVLAYTFAEEQIERMRSLGQKLQGKY